jgi:Zn-dependent protease with chaperone function
MNFFTAQEQARRRTKWLVLWFVLATAGTVVSLYLITGLLIDWYAALRGDDIAVGHELSWWTAAISSLVIPAGSAYKFMQLSQGGGVVARDLGARRVHPLTQDFSERQLLNVVEEMAIASGVPVPEVWIMDEELSINAFAAGTEPSNAVVGVSRGCLKKLTRAELQGVIAHEFSHILNGDMRMNMRLIGWVFGLLMIAMAGRGILSSLRHVRVRSSGDNKSGNGYLIIIVAGAVLWLVGSLGVFFARIIQAAVSRQREYLADASAVQFTRDPSGIAGALKKIARLPQQRVLSPHASEAAHLLFHGPVGFLFPGLLATHPPLIKRIHAIDPSWDGDLRKVGTEEGSERALDGKALVAPFSTLDLGQAGALRQSMTKQGAVSTVAQAKALMFSLVAGDSKALVVQPVTTLDAEEQAALDYWWLRSRGMNSAEKIAWMDLAIPTLRQMSPEEYRQFREDLQKWTMNDGHVSIFEWMLHHAINRHLLGAFERLDVVPVRWHDIAPVEDAVAVLLACLCQPSGQASAWSQCAQEYQQRFGRALPRAAADFQQLQESLWLLEQASADLKNRILDLCRWVTLLDGTQCNGEREILRATADAIGVMLPPASVTG